MSQQDKTTSIFLENIQSWCIAITGAVATGKSTVAGILRNLGFTVIDADHLAREVVQPGQLTLDSIIREFGQSILKDTGELNRDKLRTVVMHDETARKKLESIIHPAIEQAFRAEVSTQNLGHGKIFFYEAALIFERNRQDIFRETWVTTCSEKTQLQRLQARSGLPIASCKQIIDSQWSAAKKSTLGTRVINTDCDKESLIMNIKDLVKVTRA